MCGGRGRTDNTAGHNWKLRAPHKRDFRQKPEPRSQAGSARRWPHVPAAPSGRGRWWAWRSVSRERRLGGPLSPRAGRVAKEMTARSGSPCQQGGVWSSAFPLPLSPRSCPVTASWPASRLSPAPCVGCAAGLAPCHTRPRGPGSGAGKGRVPLACFTGRRPAAAMGAYLSQPNTVKCSGDGVGAPRLPLPYGFSAMQGWRVSMEVRRQGPRGWPLHGESLTEKGSGGGDGALLGRGSLTGACDHSAGGGGERGILAEREQLELGGPRRDGRWRRERCHVGRGTFRPLAAGSRCLRAILCCQPSPPGSQAARGAVVRAERKGSLFVR